MLCIEQAKIYQRPKFGRDRAFGGWTIGKWKCQIFAWLTRGGGGGGGAMLVDGSLWYIDNMAAKKTKAKIKPSFNKNGQVSTKKSLKHHF